MAWVLTFLTTSYWPADVGAGDGQGAVAAVGREDEAGGGVEDAAVGAGADLQGLDDLAAVGVGDDELAVGAGAEEAAGLGVEGQAGRLLAGGEGEAAEDLQGLGVDLDDLEVSSMLTKTCPFSSETASSGTPPRARLPTGFMLDGVDGGGVVGPVVEGEDPAGGRLVIDDVGPAVGLDLADRREGLEVEDGDAGVAAVAGEAPVEVGGEGDPVDAGGVLDLADDLLGVEVDDDDPGAPADVKLAVRGVDFEEVPGPLRRRSRSYRAEGSRP